MLHLLSSNICAEWRKKLQNGALQDKITVDDLASLIENAPQAARDLLDALTDEPVVENREHHPLPVRANIPRQNESCRLSCAYVKDLKWHWTTQSGQAPGWHRELAPPDPKRGQDVKVRVVHMKGLASCRLIHCLASTRDYKVFAKLGIHGLLKYLWSRFCWMFMLDLLHQACATAVISFWIWGLPLFNPGQGFRCTLWCIMSSQGIMDCALFVWTCCVCLSKLGSKQLMNWLCRCWGRAAIGISTVVLATQTQDGFMPGDGSELILALSSLLHWLLLLYELRAFQWTGKRLLPIMKSVVPITGMLVIMLFLSLGFVHAFWALDRGNINDVSLYVIIMMLFTGNLSPDQNDLAAVDPGKKDLFIVVTLVGVFVFLTCTINVFIAVLGDCYDQEQERMICTFMQERAGICSGFFLRPKLHVQGVFETGGVIRTALSVLLLVVLTTAFGLLVFGAAQGGVSPWVGAFFLTAAILVIQCILRDRLTTGWKSFHLWICHESCIDEEMFLAPDERDLVENSGRISRIKKYITDQSRTLACQSNLVSREVRESREECRMKLDEFKAKLDSLAVAISGTTGPAETALAAAAGPAGSATPPAAPELASPAAGKIGQPDNPEGLPGPPTHTVPVFACTGLVKQDPADSLAATVTAVVAAAPRHRDAAKPAEGGCGKPGMQAAIEDLRCELAEVKGKVADIHKLVHKQSETQERLERTCMEVADALKKVVEAANRRRNATRKDCGDAPTAAGTMHTLAATTHSSTPPAMTNVSAAGGTTPAGPAATFPGSAAHAD